MSVRLYCILILLAVLVYSQSLGQTTKPAASEPPAAWQQFVASFAKSLSDDTDDSADSGAIASALADDATIQKFGAVDPASRLGIRPLTSGLSVVSAHAYLWPIDQFASDLAADMRDSNAVSDELRRQFTPRDDAEAKRANLTSQQWLSTLLHPDSGQFVAAIVLCESQKPLVFVLIKGKKIDEDQFRITHLVFGDPRQAL